MILLVSEFLVFEEYAAAKSLADVSCNPVYVDRRALFSSSLAVYVIAQFLSARE